MAVYTFIFVNKNNFFFWGGGTNAPHKLKN